MHDPLSEADRSVLLGLARGAIVERLGADATALSRRLESLRLTPALEARRGAFVTLTEIGGALRGCVGLLRPTRPLYRTVVEMAPQAALEDPRFPPLTRDELDRVRISVSALTPCRPLADYREIVIGRDGVLLEHDDNRAVFLPHIAVEQRWDRSRLLEQLSRKAGLAPDGWRSGRLYVFGAESFAESDSPTASSAERKIKKY